MGTSGSPDFRVNLSFEELTITSDVSLVMSPVTACITTFPSLVSCCPELETTLEKHPFCCTEKKKVSHKDLLVNSEVKQL